MGLQLSLDGMSINAVYVDISSANIVELENSDAAGSGTLKAALVVCDNLYDRNCWEEEDRVVLNLLRWYVRHRG
jgi:hypothetical protein